MVVRVKVGIAMADDDSRGIDALFHKNGELGQPHRIHRGMRRKRRSSTALRSRRTAQNALFLPGHIVEVDPDLADNASPNSGIGNALGQLADHQVR